MKNTLLMILLLFQGVGFVPFSEKKEDVKLEVRIKPEEGWMNGGYGSLIFEFTNNSGVVIETGQVTGEWDVGGEGYNKWDWEPKLTISEGEKKAGSLISWMPPKTEKLAENSIPKVKGNVRVVIGENEIVLPFSVEVPVAKLPTPLVSQKGKYIELILQEKTWENVNSPQKVMNYIDEAYAAMYELTANRPYNGDLMALKECPRNPYFAYAGNPIVLNGAYVPKSVGHFDNDEVDFGWIHEMGHDFDDVIGHFYNYGTFTEFQANIKLSYAIEKLCTHNSKLKIKSWVDKQTMLTGTAFNDEYFAPAGDNYLADTSRLWETLKSDEYHALFHSVIRKHGWELMKKYYKSFGKLKEAGINPPKGKERIFLSLTILDKCCDEDLVSLYQNWRIPVDSDMIEMISKKYQLN